MAIKKLKMSEKEEYDLYAGDSFIYIKDNFKVDMTDPAIQKIAKKLLQGILNQAIFNISTHTENDCGHVLRQQINTELASKILKNVTKEILDSIENRDIATPDEIIRIVTGDLIENDKDYFIDTEKFQDNK